MTKKTKKLWQENFIDVCIVLFDTFNKNSLLQIHYLVNDNNRL